MTQTLEQIRRDGLEALRKKLGVAGMIRFLQQFDHGHGDYVVDRRKWADKTTLKNIRASAKRNRSASRK